MFVPNYQALSLFRVLFSLYLLFDYYIDVYPYSEAFFTDSGILPLSVLSSQENRAGLSFMLPMLWLLDALGIQTLFPVLYTAALTAFGLGYKTRWANAMAFALNGYLYWRNPYLRSGAEQLSNLLLLWSWFLPLNRYWSIDSALTTEARDPTDPQLPFVAMSIQISSVYVFAALFKLAGLPWRDGSAISWALGDNVFGSTPVSLFLLREYPVLLNIITYITIVFQLAFPLLLYSPWRNDLTRAFALICAAMMHVSFIFCLNIGGFPYISLIALVLLVPDTWINRFLRSRRARLGRITIFYDPNCGFCHRISLLLREFLLTRTSLVLPASADPHVLRLLTENNSWVVRDENGQLHLKWSAMAYLLKQHMILAPLGHISDFHVFGGFFNWAYDFVGRNRHRLGPSARILLPFGCPYPTGGPATTLCGLLAVLALASNISSVYLRNFNQPTVFDHFTAALQVRQRWALFAPVPTNAQWQFRIMARVDEQTLMDLMDLPKAPLYRSGDGQRIEFASARWRRYFTFFAVFSEADWAALGNYFCLQARLMPGLDRVQEIEITVDKSSILDTAGANVQHIQRAFNCK